MGVKDWAKDVIDALNDIASTAQETDSSPKEVRETWEQAEKDDKESDDK